MLIFTLIARCTQKAYCAIRVLWLAATSRESLCIPIRDRIPALVATRSKQAAGAIFVLVAFLHSIFWKCFRQANVKQEKIQANFDIPHHITSIHGAKERVSLLADWFNVFAQAQRVSQLC